MTVADRFWKHVDKAGDCWVWTAYIAPHGYGALQISKSIGPRSAHRVSWEVNRGPIPAGVYVLHKCDNRKCVNPAHLFLGTQAENMRDMVSKGRSLRGEKCGRRKLNAVQVDEIRLHTLLKVPQKDIAAKYGITRENVRLITNGKYWKPSALPMEA